MKRYYISPIIGDGTKENPYRPKISNYGVSFVSLLPMGPDGKPSKDWCLCHVETDNHQRILRDSEVEALPDVSLDVKWTAVGTAVKQRLENVMTARGIALQSDGQSGYRDIVRQVGRSLVESFDENSFSV